MAARIHLVDGLFRASAFGGAVVERLRRLETQLGSQVGAVVFACDVGHAGPKGGA